MTLGEAPSTDDRIGTTYLAPWVDIGGSDKGTIDLFRWLDRDRFRLSLITTQPSPNRMFAVAARFADEVWPLPELMAGDSFVGFILEFIRSREIRVLHIMNSRLGFNLLPDLLNLKSPPVVVVQLHVEEEDRSGYVRYVTTRYGNLVDAFSVTSHHLADVIERDYEIPRSKCRVIPTGVDAEREFSPECVAPVNGLSQGPLHILFAGRLVRQKNPLLMVDVASELEAFGLDFRIHVLGEGNLEKEVREQIDGRGLAEKVLLHGPRPTIAPWLAAADVLLMTSAFEGVPYVIYEAMAMGVPAVAPALPGVVELLPGNCGRIVSSVGDASQYASALAELARDPVGRQRLGAQARAHARKHFSVQEMADAHGELYLELLQRRGLSAAYKRVNSRNRAPIRCARREAKGNPLVSVIVPCFDHGKYLLQCLESIQDQTYAELETVVVDDASTDPSTIDVIDHLVREGEVNVIQLHTNVGPGAARNVALREAKGRYILPVDADNLLLPDAIQRLVNQLRNAGERVGYIYPNLQFFGNRKDYFEAPEFNLHHLLNINYCDTCSLVDRDVFDAGIRYSEAKIGHEDWDFALQLAEREVYGEPARTKTLLYRKHGFTRSDLVEHRRESFSRKMRKKHHALYRDAPSIKASWSPALSVISLKTSPAGIDAEERLRRQLRRQSVSDFELLVRSESEWRPMEDGPGVRRLAPALARNAAEACALGLATARGRFVVVTEGTGSELLDDRTFCEKILRILQAEPGAAGLALVDTGAEESFHFKLLHQRDKSLSWRPHTLAWSLADDQLLAELETVLAGEPIYDLARAFGPHLQWRHFPAPPHRCKAATNERITISTRPRPLRRQSEVAEREARLNALPLYSAKGPVPIRRLTNQPRWFPPATLPLVRHCAPEGKRTVTNKRLPPPGFEFEFDLGVLNLFPFQGTAELVCWNSDGGQDYRLLAPAEARPVMATSLGYVELAAFRLLEPLLLAHDPATEQRVLVAGDDDPLITRVEPIETLGWIESYPVKPKGVPGQTFPVPSVGLVRVVDRFKRRHIYGIGEIPDGELAGELGALELEEFPGALPVWLTSDRIVATEDYVPPVRRPTLYSAVRWSLAPARWWGFGRRAGRVKAVVRRILEATKHIISPPSERRHPGGSPHGYLLPHGRPGTVPLYSSVHPVTYDQLLTTNAGQAADMGFVETQLLGHLIAHAPLTGSLDTIRPTIPWASRFGEQIRAS